MKIKICFSARFPFLPLLILFCCVLDYAEASPKRDHLTKQEADMVRDTQELDKRIAILIKAADRRLLAVANPSAAKTAPGDIDLIGELKGTRADFLYDLSMILDEAITNIDDVSGRDERNPLIPKAIRTLAEASRRVVSQLAPLRDNLEAGPESQSFARAIENAESVIEAAEKLPPPMKNNKKKESN